MPTRLLVLDLDPSSADNKLVPTTKIEPYAVLSYCRGGDQPQRLTTWSGQGNAVGIDTAQLPLRIRDTVKVTTELGLLYLWVDCLCIVQDDPQDVAKQIAQMPDIYS